MSEPSPPVTATAPGPPETEGFHGAMVHLYRGEMQRMTTWRQRLDTTSHWAILMTTAMTTFALGAAQLPHYILLLGLALTTLFLVMEARRFQHFHHSRWRIALLERGYFSWLVRPREDGERWRAELAHDLDQPHFTISLFLAARVRLRRNYFLLLCFLTAVWLTKLYIHPQSPRDLGELYRRLAIGDLFPSWFVLITAGIFVLTCSLLVCLTPSEETLQHWTSERHRERTPEG